MEKNASNKEYQELMERENMYRQIIEYSLETIVIHADHKILYINQSGANFLRAAKEDIIGARVLDVFQEKDRPAIKERIQKAMTENIPGGTYRTCHN
ncbi:PAS domain-containing protein [Bacillus sp. V59.32b]|uniref:PAS domain-containing protein n=1 Tax=Bacillus sp. V59.32b TaxID=1758642 RepID=UPI0026D2BCC4